MLTRKKCAWCGVGYTFRTKNLHMHCKKAYHRGKIDGGFNKQEVEKIKSAVKLIDGAFKWL